MITFQAVLVHLINENKGGDQEITLYCGDSLTEACNSLSDISYNKWRQNKKIFVEIWAKKIVAWENGEIKEIKYLFRHKAYLGHYNLKN